LLSAKLWSNAPPYQQYSPREFLNSLSESGLTVTNTSSVGFGPFTFFGHHLFPEAIGIRINNKLQEYADNKYPILRSTGSQYIVLAAKK